MSGLFRFVLIVWAAFHIAWMLVRSYEPSMEWIFIVLVVVGGFTFVAALLWDRLPLIRFLFLIGVIGYFAFLVANADFSTYDEYDYQLLDEDPSTAWVTDIGLLLDGVVLILVYATPIADDFEKRRWAPRTRLGATLAVLVRSDGAKIASITTATLVVFVVIQLQMSVSYAAHSPRAAISRAPSYLQAVEASGGAWDKALAYFDVAETYWLLKERDQAAALYEKILALRPESSHAPEVWGVPTWVMSGTVARLLEYYSTEPDERFGDGSKALKLAETYPGGFAEPSYFDAVAAIHARLGQWREAIEDQKQAMLACTEGGSCCEELEQYASHLREYRWKVESP